MVSLRPLCAHTPSICDGTFTGTSLNLYNEDLNGTIPTELFQHTQLTDLGLDDNQLFGTVPTEIGRLTQLVALNLGVNQFTGTVPTEIGRLTLLQHLYIERNRLSGTVPTEMGRLTQLITLDLYRNSLSGTLPTELNQIHPTADCRFTIAQCNAAGPGCGVGGVTNAFSCPRPTLPEYCARNIGPCPPTAAEAATATAGASLVIIIVAAAAAVVVVAMALAALWCLCRRKGPAGKESHKAKAATEKVAEGPAKNVVLQALEA